MKRVDVVLPVILFLVLASGCGEPISDGSDSRQPDGKVEEMETKLLNSDEAAKTPEPKPVPAIKKAPFTSRNAAAFVLLALDCAVQEYPNKIAHAMTVGRRPGHAAVAPSRPSTAASTGTPRCMATGCWPGSRRLYPDHDLAADARTVLEIT